MLNREHLIKKLKENGILEIHLNNNEEIYIAQYANSNIAAERDIWNEAIEDWELVKDFGFFKNIEDLFKMLEEKGILIFKD